MKSDNAKKYIYDLVTLVLFHSFVNIKINCTVKLQKFLELYLRELEFVLKWAITSLIHTAGVYKKYNSGNTATPWTFWLLVCFFYQSPHYNSLFLSNHLKNRSNRESGDAFSGKPHSLKHMRDKHQS